MEPSLKAEWKGERLETVEHVGLNCKKTLNLIFFIVQLLFSDVSAGMRSDLWVSKYVMFWLNALLSSLFKACPRSSDEQTTCWSSDELAELLRGTRRTSDEQSVAPERQSSDKFCMTPSIIDGEAGAAHHPAGTHRCTYMHARTQLCASTHEFDCVVRRVGIFK